MLRAIVFELFASHVGQEYHGRRGRWPAPRPAFPRDSRPCTTTFLHSGALHKLSAQVALLDQITSLAAAF